MPPKIYRLCGCPYEADAELAFLLKQAHADFVISEDSDLLAYGCKKVSLQIVYVKLHRSPSLPLFLYPILIFAFMVKVKVYYLPSFLL